VVVGILWAFCIPLVPLTPHLKETRVKRKDGENTSDGMAGGIYIPGRKIFARYI